MKQVSDNIRFLRKRERWTQEQFAEKIGIKRSLLGAYEEDRADPRLNNLLNMSRVFGVSVDTLMTEDLTTLNDEELEARKNSKDGVAVKKEKEFKILSITVDPEENENIELVPQKASAGYTNGYMDPEYLEDLPKFQLPILPDIGTYRAFEINGDSMLPLQSGTIIIGRYVENIRHIVNGKTYVLVTKQEGVVYKRVFNYIDENGKLKLVSDNLAYSAYDVDASDVSEVWESRAYISLDFPDPESKQEMSIDKLTSIVMDLQQEVIRLKN